MLAWTRTRRKSGKELPHPCARAGFFETLFHFHLDRKNRPSGFSTWCSSPSAQESVLSYQRLLAWLPVRSTPQRHQGEVRLGRIRRLSRLRKLRRTDNTCRITENSGRRATGVFGF